MPIIKKPSFDISNPVEAYKNVQANKTIPQDAPAVAPTSTNPYAAKKGMESKGTMAFIGENSKPTSLWRKALGFALGPVGQLALEPEKRELAVEGVKGAAGSIAKSAIQLPRAFVGGAASLAGAKELEEKAKKPIQVPVIGEVRSLSADPADIEKFGSQTPGESLEQSASMFLEAGAPGAGKIAKRIVSPITSKIPSLQKATKAASSLTNVPEEAFIKASQPETAQMIQKIRKTGGAQVAAQDVAEQLFTESEGVVKKAMDEYKLTRSNIISQNKGKILERSKELVDKTKNSLLDEGITFGQEGVDLRATQFEDNPVAKEYFERVNKLISRPVTTVRKAGKEIDAIDDLMSRREALTNIVNEIPLDQRNVRRVVNNMVDNFDTYLDEIIEQGGSKETIGQMRQSYAKAMQAGRGTLDLIADNVNGKYVPNLEKADRFVKRAMANDRSAQSALLAKLDQELGDKGIEFSKAIEALGVEKAISQLDPPTKGRVFDVLKTYGVTKIPLLSAIVSPKAWGEVMLSQGLKAAEASRAAKTATDEIGNLILKNLFTAPLREEGQEVIMDKVERGL